ncbi:MAG: hypothetical protein OEV43_07575 [Coriobacteriia bacterium]|nr:hypothetical protein [Coriobacteriia bacterium]
MNRSRRVAVVAHCLLNMNSKVEGLATCPGVHPILGELADRDYGLLQLPCPELTMLGLKRWGQTFEQYDTPFFRAHCARLVADVAAQVSEYVRCGYEIGPVVGVQGSPSCGVTQTMSGAWGGEYDDDRMRQIRSRRERVDGAGVFFRELAERLEPYGVAFTWVDDREPDGGIARIAGVLEGGL